MQSFTRLNFYWSSESLSNFWVLVFKMNDIEKSIMIGLLWDKYIKNPTDRNYQIWKNWCFDFYPKKIEDLK